jgi:cyclic pyranopterin phosphate synthase
MSEGDRAERIRMVNVGEKQDSDREAVARGVVTMRPETVRSIVEGTGPKGDVLAAAQLAGIMAAKWTPQLIPLCHPLLLTHVGVEFEEDADAGTLEITGVVRCRGKTGVEMEALTATSVAALTVYDMVKAIDDSLRITDIRLVRKKGGKSGEVVFED